MTGYRKPPFLHLYTDRHGKRRIYYRQPGKKHVALRGPLFGPEFWQDYNAARDGEALKAPEIGASKTKPGSFNALIATYFKSAGFISLEPSTKITYRGQLEKFRQEFGDMSVASIKAKHIDAILGKLAEHSTAQAHKLRKRLSMLMRLAVKWEFRSDNPMLNVDRVRHKEVPHRTWTEEDIAKYRAYWPATSPERTGLEVLLHTGLRRSDAAKLGRQHVQDGCFVITAKKTKAKLAIPIHQDLHEFLRQLPMNCLTFIVANHGHGRSEEGFSNWIVKAAKAAGLPPHSSPHGLRSAACVRLAEAGCTTLEIMAITGHTSVTEVERYTRDANRKRLARSAMDTLENAQNTTATKLANPLSKVAKLGG